MNWLKGFRGSVKLKERLSGHTSFKIGGPCDYFLEPEDKEDLKLLLGRLKRYKIPFLVLGAGTNILVSDKGVRKAVIRLSSPDFTRLTRKGNYVEAGAGCFLARFISFTKKQGLGGNEFLSGIPGTIGGALTMNAGGGRRGSAFGDLVKSASVMDYNGKIKTLNRKKLRFGYRESNIRRCIVLSAKLKLESKKAKEIDNNLKGYVRLRSESQDLSRPCAGSIFKNPSSEPAGRLIELCGLKGRMLGGAGISMKHANFILNLRNARFADVSELMGLIKRKVRDRFGITLEPEVEIWV